jgi:hypothetical protein
MALPSSPNAYPDCFAFLEACVDDPIGARKPFQRRDEALHFRFRCNQFRVLTRRQNCELYPPDDKRHGTSDYDEVVMTIESSEDGWFWVYGKKMSASVDDIEPLSEIEVENGNEAGA